MADRCWGFKRYESIWLTGAGVLSGQASSPILVTGAGVLSAQAIPSESNLLTGAGVLRDLGETK